MQLKVLQVIDRLEIGGAERVFLDLTHLLLNEKYTVDTLLISSRGSLYSSIDARAGKYFLNRKNKFSLFKLVECASICAKYQIIHVHMRHTYAYVKLAQLISFKKFTIIFHDHYNKIDIIPFFLKGLFKPTFYIGVSQQLIEWAVSKLKIDRTKSFLLRNVILPTDNSVEMNFKDLVMVSNISPVKNIEFAIQLANTIRRNLLIFGNALKTSYAENILDLIEDSSHVEIVQKETDVQRFFGNFTLAIHTSFSETGPLVLLEYLSRGLPFLAYETGEVAHLLKKEIPECFIKQFDVNAWKTRMQMLQENPPSPDKLMMLFNKYFGAKQYVQQCVVIYQQVASS